jgi:hypothetical protein
MPDEERTIEDDILTYINPDKGYQIIFRRATKFVKEMEDYKNSTTSSVA